MAITILQNHDHTFEKVADICCKSVKDYARRHNYNYLCYIGRFGTVSPAWDKILLTKMHLMHSKDIIWKIDSDIIIKDPSVRLESLFDDNFDINLCGTGEPGNVFSKINSGSVFWKPTRASLEVLNEMLAFSRRHPEVLWEQGTLSRSMLKDGADKIFKRHHFDKFNHEGDFLIHFCGVRNIEDKLRQIADYLRSEVYIPASDLLDK